MREPARPFAYESVFSVVGRDVDCFSQCQAAALLSYLQETGLLAMAEGGLTRDYLMGRYHAVWMLARARYTLETPIRLEDVITIRSACYSAHGMGIYHEYEIIRDSVKIGEALALWMLVEAEKRAFFPVNRVAELSGVLDRNKKSQKLGRLALPDALTPVHRRTVRYSQADMNGHLNNSRYADLICDAIGLENMDGAYLSRLQIGYLSECLPGCTLTMYTQGQENLWYIRGTGDDSIPRFEAAAELKYPQQNTS